MSDVTPRLVKCFQTVFPEMPETQIRAANQQSVPMWDSVATVTLVNVVDEEFNVELDLEKLDQLNSFESFERHLSAAQTSR